MPDKRVRTRFAPSPTGFLHIGGVRTALYAQLLAKKHGGDFLLRVEDTDQARLVPGAVENLCRTLHQLDITPDEGVWLDENGAVTERGGYGPYTQSKRQAIHQKYAQELVAMDKAYPCFCTAERLDELRQTQEITKRPTGYDGHCRNLDKQEAQNRIANGEKHVIRLKLPKEGNVTIHDVIRGDVTFDWKLIDDQVIIKSDGMATYHLASMVDDHDMAITHVIRGEEWLSSAPKHVFIYESFGWELPVFAHLPLILNPDKSKLSKRQGDVAAEDYLQKGYLPQALINFLALLGWNPSGEREIYSHDELAELFNLEKINKAGAVFNLEKLNWLNNHYLRLLPDEEYLALINPHLPAEEQDHEFKQRIAFLFRERLTLPSEISAWSEFFFADKLDYSAVKLNWKDHSTDEAVERLKTAKTWIEELAEEQKHDASVIETIIKDKIQTQGWGNGDTLWPLRVALSGAEKSPSPFELIAAYGQKRSLARIDEALAFLLK